MPKLISKGNNNYRFEGSDFTLEGSLIVVVRLMMMQGYESDEIEKGFQSLVIEGKECAEYGIFGKFMF